MEWTYVALLQMFLITAGVCGAFWLRIRNFRAQNEVLRSCVEEAEQRAAEATSAPSPDNMPKGPVAREWLKEQLEEIPEDDITAPIQQAVIKHLIKNERKFDSKLLKTIEKNGLGGVEGDAGSEPVDDTQAARIAELEAEIESLKSQPGTDNVGAATAEATQDDMRDLLQQFTHDTRDMMACINELEKENAQLRVKLGLPADDAVEPPAAGEAETETSPAEVTDEITDEVTEALQAFDEAAEQEDQAAQSAPTPEAEPEAPPPTGEPLAAGRADTADPTQDPEKESAA